MLAPDLTPPSFNLKQVIRQINKMLNHFVLSNYPLFSKKLLISKKMVAEKWLRVSQLEAQMEYYQKSYDEISEKIIAAITFEESELNYLAKIIQHNPNKDAQDLYKSLKKKFDNSQSSEQALKLLKQTPFLLAQCKQILTDIQNKPTPVTVNAQQRHVFDIRFLEDLISKLTIKTEQFAVWEHYRLLSQEMTQLLSDSTPYQGLNYFLFKDVINDDDLLIDTSNIIQLPLWIKQIISQVKEFNDKNASELAAISYLLRKVEFLLIHIANHNLVLANNTILDSFLKIAKWLIEEHFPMMFHDARKFKQPAIFTYDSGSHTLQMLYLLFTYNLVAADHRDDMHVFLAQRYLSDIEESIITLRLNPKNDEINEYLTQVINGLIHYHQNDALAFDHFMRKLADKEPYQSFAYPQFRLLSLAGHFNQRHHAWAQALFYYNKAQAYLNKVSERDEAFWVDNQNKLQLTIQTLKTELLNMLKENLFVHSPAPQMSIIVQEKDTLCIKLNLNLAKRSVIQLQEIFDCTVISRENLMDASATTPPKALKLNNLIRQNLKVSGIFYNFSIGQHIINALKIEILNPYGQWEVIIDALHSLLGKLDKHAQAKQTPSLIKTLAPKAKQMTAQTPILKENNLSLELAHLSLAATTQSEPTLKTVKVKTHKAPATPAPLVNIIPVRNQPILYAQQFGFSSFEGAVTPFYSSKQAQIKQRTNIFLAYKYINGLENQLITLFQNMLNPHPEGIVAIGPLSLNKSGAKMVCNPENLQEDWHNTIIRFKRCGKQTGSLRILALAQEKISVSTGPNKTEDRFLFCLGKAIHK